MSPDSTQQEQHTATEIQAMLREAIDDCNRKENEDGDKTSYNKLIMIVLDHLVAIGPWLRVCGFYK